MEDDVRQRALGADDAVDSAVPSTGSSHTIARAGNDGGDRGDGGMSSGEDSGDEAGVSADYRLLSSMLASSSASAAAAGGRRGGGGGRPEHSLPQRGEKDFEPDGTKRQDRVLASSREAMYAALSVERDLSAKSYVRGAWHPGRGVASVAPAFVRGIIFKATGRADSQNVVWLTAEETLFLVDRGSMELFWEGTDLAMSVQAAWAACLQWVPLHEYLVYANLRRAGFALQRAAWPDGTSSPAHSTKPTPRSGWSFFTALSSIQRRLALILQAAASSASGIFPGHSRHYRSWHALYRSLPTTATDSIASDSHAAQPPSAQNRLRIAYRVWRPGSNFRKSAPGVADYSLAILPSSAVSPSASASPSAGAPGGGGGAGGGDGVMSLGEIEDLFQSLTVDPLASASAATGGWALSGSRSGAGSGNRVPSKMQRLKRGARSCLLAVVDAGIISYLQLGDSRFDAHPVYPVDF